MLFHFRLRPVAEIAPFGHDRLHWFGLTDGWYWLSAGDAELFRYSSEARSEPYVDYYIARLWEDLLEMLPAILDPVPAMFAGRLASWDDWTAWYDRARTCEDEAWFDLLEQAVSWWGLRKLDIGYLRHGPRIWFWRVGDTIHLRWDNRHAFESDMAVWEAVTGTTSMPVGAFLAEVQSFHDRFMASMAERVAEACRGWRRPDVRLDLDSLRREHDARALRLADSLQAPQAHDWQAAVAAFTKLDEMMTGGADSPCRQ